MKIKTFVKSILALGTLAGTAYAAYKFGEVSGEVNERFREKYGDDEDERGFYDHMDEPDDGCISPVNKVKPVFTVGMFHFAPLDSIKVDGVTAEQMDMLVYHISLDKFTSNKQIREWLEVDKATAAKVISALRKAGYVGEERSNYMIPVLITTEVYFRLRGEAK